MHTVNTGTIATKIIKGLDTRFEISRLLRQIPLEF